MQYRFKIVSNTEPDKVVFDSRSVKIYPYYFEPDALIAGGIQMGILGLNTNTHHIVTTPVKDNSL